MRKLFKFSLHKGKLNEETIWNCQAFMNSKKNSCRGNYMRKYGMYNVQTFIANITPNDIMGNMYCCF